MRLRSLAIGLALLGTIYFSGSAVAQTTPPLRIVGALSNFDCYNDTGDDCSGFEIEIQGLHKEDVIHTWNFSAYGAPVVTTIGTPTNPSVLVRYFSNSSVVHNGSFTHFGVTTSVFVGPGKIQYRWLPTPSVVMPNPPPVPINLPLHASHLDVNGILDSVQNTTSNILWVLPFRNHLPRHCELEELMPNDPIVLQAEPMGSGTDHLRPHRLDPGDTWQDDDPPGSDDHQSAVICFEVYEDVYTPNPHGPDRHEPGRMIAKIMDSTLSTDAIIDPPTPNGVFLSDAQVIGTQIVEGMVTLKGQAPLGGTTVTLSTSNDAAFVPPTVQVPENDFHALFNVTTSAVSTTTPVTVFAEANGVSKSQLFSIQPAPIQLVYLSRLKSRANDVRIRGSVFLLGVAGPGGSTVALNPSSNALVTPSSVIVPPGQSTVGFAASTGPVSTTTTVRLNASLNGQTVFTDIVILP